MSLFWLGIIIFACGAFMRLACTKGRINTTAKSHKFKVILRYTGTIIAIVGLIINIIGMVVN